MEGKKKNETRDTATNTVTRPNGVTLTRLYTFIHKYILNVCVLPNIYAHTYTFMDIHTLLNTCITKWMDIHYAAVHIDMCTHTHTHRHTALGTVWNAGASVFLSAGGLRVTDDASTLKHWGILGRQGKPRRPNEISHIHLTAKHYG